MELFYKIRKATRQDICFLVDVIIAAEKSNTEKLSFSTMFNLEEHKVKKLLFSMLEEEIEGCEISLDSFLIAEYNSETVAAFGGWIEGFADQMSSKILKSNLISYYFGKESIMHLKNKAHLIKDILIDREEGALQLEYLYIETKHRGKDLTRLLIDQHIRNAKLIFPNLTKIQIQVYKNNLGAIKSYQKSDFVITKSFKANDSEVTVLLPFDEKILMEKTLN